MNELDSRTVRRVEAIRAALTSADLTANQLAAAIHAVPQSAQEYVRHLIDPSNQRIRIVNWLRTPGHIIAVYRWGAGPNKPRPAAMTAAQCEAARIKRVRKDPDAYERHLSKARARYMRLKAVKRPATWLSALGAP